ncbi:conserved hypothetical protein [Methylobacterium sp. 4-46]|uniref:hypothetical protein n=1 Tax=unclassified Methylobacterium TaxID=2615210 RepID=UPI000152DED3|nr:MULTISPECIES: hypothetical protein [Methylobacterium]ACA20502.1 conserved hypothetical protein [Methylobacterium sp. 4-46]WFT79667.1 4-aminobutyrate aminotransferase [Methylobacterium nodulans]
MIRPIVALAASALLVGPLLASPLLAGPALAQAAKTIERSVAPGKQILLLTVPNLKKDCSLGPQPELKVTAPPKNGALIQRAGRRKTPATYRCPNVEANVQAMFYESKAGFTGTDELTVEVKGADGTISVRVIKIKVGGGETKSDTTDL